VKEGFDTATRRNFEAATKGTSSVRNDRSEKAVRIPLRAPATAAAGPLIRVSSASENGWFSRSSGAIVGNDVLLDRETCRKARLARDPRFDGRFFIAVRTTRIFCRPICPARSPREENVEYYPSAAAAATAGFRPCLRCRPECAPGTPAWNGSSTTVARALREISEGTLDEAGVRKLAERLGVGDRHLRRLFVEHLGAPPIAVAQTHRLLSAKRLLNDTDLPVTAIALASGFGSVRRFNDAFRKTWNRSPRDLRRTRRSCKAASLRFRLRYRAPFDWNALLAFLESRAIPGVECVSEGVYRRSIVLSGVPGSIEVAHCDSEVILDVHHPDSGSLLAIVSRARRLFDLDADPLAIAACLGSDPLLRPLVRARPGLRVPGAWDAFELGIRAILGQQVSVAGASTLVGRLVLRFGRPFEGERAGVTHLFPEAADLAEADVASIGLPRQRAQTVRAFAAAVARGEIVLDNRSAPEELRKQLQSIAGIGTWTAGYIALRAFNDPDALPSGDLVLLRATSTRTTPELDRRAERWRPWRAYAALHLWQGVRDGHLLSMDGKSNRAVAAGGG
jgi:AraC family transcriptional regulator of adaptative response / DNA-3-methyladenine glycosylase II